jgi:hypothetical protein
MLRFKRALTIRQGLLLFLELYEILHSDGRAQLVALAHVAPYLPWTVHHTIRLFFPWKALSRKEKSIHGQATVSDVILDYNARPTRCSAAVVSKGSNDQFLFDPI